MRNFLSGRLFAEEIAFKLAARAGMERMKRWA
jgi:hypothetical protein